jgi:hypothetical protein
LFPLFASPGGRGELLLIFFSFLFRAFLGVFETVAFTVGFDDVDAMGKAVQERGGESFVTEYFGPLFEGQVGGQQHALPFIGAAEHFEEQLVRRRGLGEGHIAELVENKQVLFLDTFEEAN